MINDQCTICSPFPSMKQQNMCRIQEMSISIQKGMGWVDNQPIETFVWLKNYKIINKGLRLH